MSKAEGEKSLLRQRLNVENMKDIYQRFIGGEWTFQFMTIGNLKNLDFRANIKRRKT